MHTYSTGQVFERSIYIGYMMQFCIKTFYIRFSVLFTFLSFNLEASALLLPQFLCLHPVVLPLHVCLKRMQTSGWARGSHRQAGARLSHNHRICKDFNNEPLGLMIENRSGVNSCMHMLMWCRDAPYIWMALLEAWKHSWIYSDRFTSSALGENTQRSWWRSFLWTGSLKAFMTRLLKRFWSRRERRTGLMCRVWFNPDLQHHMTRFICNQNQILQKLRRNQNPQKRP